MYKGIFVVAGIVAVVAFAYALREVFAAATVSLVLFYILDPVANFVTGKTIGKGVKIPRVWGALIAELVGVAAITIFLFMLIPPIIEQIERMVRNMPEYLNRIDFVFRQIQHKYQRINLPPQMQNSVLKSIDKVAAESSGLIQHAANGVGKFFDQIILLLMIPFLTFYLMLEKEAVKSALTHIFPRKWQDEIQTMLSQSSQALRGYIAGQMLLSVIMGVCMTIAFSVMGLNAPLLLGLIAGVTKMIPVIGNLIGCLPAALVALSISTKLAVGVIVAFSILQLVENKVILPVMMSHYVDLSPLTILCSLMVGEQIGGVLGMFVATPVTAVLRVVYMHLRARYD